MCAECEDELGGEAEAPIQTKLTVGAPDDPYEQEADAVADEVMRTPDPQLSVSDGESSQAKNRSAGGETIPDAGLMHTKQIALRVQRQNGLEEDALLQAKSAGDTASEITSEVDAGIQALRGGGQSLSSSERSFFEPRFGADFSGIRVHNDARAASVARSANARAFALGNDVVFGQGEYSSANFSGRKLLAHELTHVVQQNGGQQQTADNRAIRQRSQADAISRLSMKAVPGRLRSTLVQRASPTAAVDESQPLVTRLPITAGSRNYWVELIARGGSRFLRVSLEGTDEKLEVRLAQSVPAGATATLASKTIGPDESSVIINLSGGATTWGYWVKVEPSPYEAASDTGRPDRVTLFNGVDIVDKDFFPQGAGTRLSPTDVRFSTAMALPPSYRATNPARMVLELSPRSQGGGTWMVLKLQKTGQMARVLLPDVNINQGTVRLVGQSDPGQDSRGNARSETNLEVRDSSNNVAGRIRVLFTSWANTGNVQEGYTYTVTGIGASSERRGRFTVPPSSTNATDFHTRLLASGDPNVRSSVSGDQALAVQLMAPQAGGLRLQFWRTSPTASQIRFTLTSTAFNQSQQFTISYSKPTLRPRVVEATGNAAGRLFVNLDGGTAGELIVVWRRETTNRQYPFLEGAGHIVLRNFRTTELALMATGTGMDAWNGRWQKPPLPDNVIGPPKWRRFSNGYEEGWISNVDHVWIPDRLLYPQIRGARIVQMLFEQTAISAIRMIPIVGSIVMIGEAVAGREIITGRRMSTEERWVHGLLGGLVLILEAALIIRGLSGAARQARITGEVSRVRAATGMSEAEARSLLDAGGNLSASDRAFIQTARNDLQAGRTLDVARSTKLQQIVGRMNAELQQARRAVLDTLEARIEQINAARGDLNLTRARFRRLAMGGDTAQPLSDVAAALDELLTPLRRVRTVTGGGRGGSGVSTYIESLDGRFSVRITHNQVGAAPVGLPAAPRVHIFEGAVRGHGSHVVLPNGTTLSDILMALGL